MGGGSLREDGEVFAVHGEDQVEVLKVARESGYTAVVSARSGDTADSFLADLAVASGAGQIKVGSVTRSERLAKYNRLLEIEKREPRQVPYAGSVPIARWLKP